MKRTATSIFLWCLATIQTSAASSATGSAIIRPRSIPTAFFTPTNSSTNRQARHSAVIRTSLKATDNNNNNNEGAEETKEMGTWNPFSLAVLKLGLTEPAWTSSFNYKNSDGIYKCASCGSPLFPSSGKYDSGSGWPSFWKTIDSDRVSVSREWDGRIEATCANCGGHLGHVFPDGPTRGSLDEVELKTVPESDPKIGYKDGADGDSKYSRMPRYCVNGVAMKFEESSK